MFSIKSIPANIRYYLRQSLLIYLVDCLFLGVMLIALSLISLERHDLNQLKKQLANFNTTKEGTNPLTHLVQSKEVLLGRYQFIAVVLTIVIALVIGILTWQAFKKMRQDIDTFTSANWSRHTIVNYYTLTALCLLISASVTVILGWLLVNSYYWRGLELINQQWLQKPLRPIQGPRAFQPLFKNHLTDFSSHSLLNPILHESTKQNLTNQVFAQLWAPFISLIAPVYIIGWCQVTRFRKMRKA
ncbi:hypothetical protein [Latilactobacillus curvatus]|uniref:Uncharacterized protein n=1 Tax=Latilactobacillus curvatus JCM 1096 = DSM 20019 TaxID=1293592 RepID=A0AAJ0LG92_LATCU|nr:hypothetical protein [Latilactobacillus curvatus]KRK93500.1 hypothetical protein FC08_GL000041 [Latilactobacillus curvatus JCM 1096 = DSM 20019]MCT3527867.1 hypothetical protein [Latilactobacillus curvatus]MCT3529728.1 hypothetical protein [Latilactobacillus curvatus]MCT3531230.1 hypothetical protein [Latilactobacillus curvatus]MDG2982119.1 hypothetical protein [Latilactobacillus curvatus]